MTIPILLVVVVLLGAMAIPLTGLDYHLRRVALFQRRRRAKAPKAPTVLEFFQKRKKAQVPLTDVRDLIISLQLGTSMESTMSGSLARAAEQFADRGVLGERLQRNVEARLSISPESVLEGLVGDLDCRQLNEVLERIRMAAEGGISYNRVLAVSAGAIEEDIRSAVEQQIQRAPIGLAPIMVAGVFFPALILFMLPLIASAFSQLAR
jgi:hypothetical protein